MRFRLSTAGGLSPTGLALDGEVEDYQVPFVASGGANVTFTGDATGETFRTRLNAGNFELLHFGTVVFAAPARAQTSPTS